MKKRVATIYDYARLRNTFCADSCLKCPIAIMNNGSGLFCHELITKDPEKASEAILKWCDEHPIKTYKDDFFEKFPKAHKSFGRPSSCRKMIYGNKCPRCRCSDCWNQPYEESEEAK